MKPIYGSYTECETIPIYYPPQYQPQQPGIESIMIPRPVSENPAYKPEAENCVIKLRL